MTPEQMQEALGWKARADKLREKLDGWVLLQRDAYVKEVICVGEPVSYKKGDYHRVEVAVPDEIRRYAFRLWKRQIALEYNEACRKLAQFGVQTEHIVRPLPESQP